MNKNITECLFTGLIGIDPSFRITGDINRDTTIILHNEILFMASYQITDRFILCGGIDKFNELTSQQKILMAKDFNYTKKVLKKTPVLTTANAESDTNFKYFTVEEYEEASVDNSQKYDSVLSSINSLCKYIGIGNNMLLAPIFMIENKISNFTELRAILTELHNDQMIVFTSQEMTSFYVSMTAKGAKYLKNHSQKQTKKVFVAIQFNWSSKKDEKLTDETFDNFTGAIKEVCSQCGYIADIVSQNHSNYITDEIIRGIRESRFVISDFTFNNSGVYFESGFARGLEKVVLHTVHKDHIENLHFDIKQINYIEWSNLENFKQNLYDRIKAMNL